MNQRSPQVRHHSDYRPGDTASLVAQMKTEGLSYYRWSNGPNDVYAAHHHDYHKVVYVVEGSITFGLPQSDETILLSSGDRLDLPAGIIHDAVVGPHGVVCLEGHRL